MFGYLLSFSQFVHPFMLLPPCDFQYLRQLAPALLELLPLVMESHQSRQGTCDLRSLCCIGKCLPHGACLQITLSQLCLCLRAHSQQRKVTESSSFCTVTAVPADIASVPPLPMLLLKVQQSQMGVTPLNPVQGTAFANSSVDTTGSVGLQKSRF